MTKDPSNAWGEQYNDISVCIARCFKYLHHEQPGEPVIHRDLKPDNVLITGDGTAKVADFGASIRFKDSLAAEEDDGALTMTVVGSPMYCAPEIFDGNRYNTSADVYSFAMTLFECTCGRAETKQQFRQVSRMAACMGWRPKPANDLAAKHPDVWALIQECWRSEKFEPNITTVKRPTFLEITERLESMRPGTGPRRALTL